jgi:hypothetical protein
MREGQNMMTDYQLSRRAMLRGTGSAGGLLVLGLASPALAKAARVAAKPKISMYRNPSCGCCMGWAEAARKAGFTVSISETDDIMAVKQKLRVPSELTSCHTSVAGGYVIEGHVPLDAVKKLLRSKPKIRGIGVAGMPAGSPGMEVHGHDHAAEPINVMAFDAAGKVKPFA